MADNFWKERLYLSLEKICGKDVRDEILRDIHLDEHTEPDEVQHWVLKVLERMGNTLSFTDMTDVISGCACRYPKDKLLRARKVFLQRNSVEDAIAELKSQMEESLRDGMLFEPEIVDWILEHGWGVAGRLEGNSILVTKIPKSGNLRRYMSGTDPSKQRELYCHCDQVRDAIPAGILIPVEFCICGAGFYRYIWESILQKPVDVEILETVCSGGDRCSFSINLPQGLV